MKTFLSGSLLALFAASLYEALTLFGTTSRLAGDILLVFVEVVGIVLIRAEIFGKPPGYRKAGFVCMLGLSAGLVTIERWATHTTPTQDVSKAGDSVAQVPSVRKPEVRIATQLDKALSAHGAAVQPHRSAQSVRTDVRGNDNTVGSVTQEGVNNIAQIGNNNQATIEAKPLVRSMAVELQLICELRSGFKPPHSPRTLILSSGGAGASFAGLGRAAVLVPHGTRTVDSMSGRLVFRQWFSYDDTGGLIGTPIPDLERITHLDINPAWDGGSWCSRVDGARIGIFVNEHLVLDRTLAPGGFDVPETQPLQGSEELIPGWPRLSVDLGFDANVLASVR